MRNDTKPRAAIWLLIIVMLVGFAFSLIHFRSGDRDILAEMENSFSNPSNVRPARIYTVYYGFGVFSPTNIRIHAGDSVRFQNDSNIPIRIISSSVNGVPELLGFDSVGDVQPGGAFTYTFVEDGIFGYHNLNSLSEEGTVIVRPQL